MGVIHDLLESVCDGPHPEGTGMICRNHSFRWEADERFCNGVLNSFEEVGKFFLQGLLEIEAHEDVEPSDHEVARRAVAVEPMSLGEALRKHAVNYRDVESVNRVGLTRYFDGSPGLIAELKWSDGYPEEAKFSVNLAEYGLVAPDGHVYIPNYSEHVGLVDALEAAGIVKKVSHVSIGRGTGWLVKVNTDRVEVLR